MYTKQNASLFIGIILLIFVSVPITASARHNTSRVDTSSLDDDPVEEMPIPILFGVEYDDIVPDFGDPRDGGAREHEGQDMHAPQGAPIVSPTEAVVTRTGTGDSAGKYVYTVNPGGEQFRYMHLDYIADLDPGDELEAGDFIGTVGDTGNAPDGVYHLHFEIRENRTATDPYPRLTDTFTLKEKMSFLGDIFRDRKDDEEYAAFLVEEFTDEFREALNAGYNLPSAIEDALEDEGIVSQVDLQKQLLALIARIPAILSMELHQGDEGGAVVLLQFYLMYMSEGPARDALLVAGPTGYFGPLTAAAVAEYQAQNGGQVTGVYDQKTRARMTSS